jgi:hypothetical protein
MNIYCDGCGLEINPLIEYEALERDLALTICDLCYNMSEQNIRRLPVSGITTIKN